jgi:AcrR family transcriptional regulator
MPRHAPLIPRKKPSQARARATMDAILEAAAQVFADKGYAAATTNHIAQRAGVSIGSLYQYFPNKDAILYSLMEQHVLDGHELITQEMETLAQVGKITVPLIRRLIEIMLVFHEKDPVLHRVLFEEVRYLQFWEEYQRNEDYAVDVLEKFLKNTPRGRKKGGKGAVRLFCHAMEAMTHRFVLNGYKDLDREAFIDEAVDMLSRYLLDI